MPQIPFGTSAYQRDNGNQPEVRVVNMLAEECPTAQGGVTLLSRKGLLLSSTVGNGPVQAIFYEAGTFGGDVFVVSGGSLYRAGTRIGAIAGTGPVSFASSGSEIVITAGFGAYSYNGIDLAEIAFPDGANVTAVAFIAGLFIYARAGTQKFYWSATLDGRTIDALDFASAESSPDGITDIIVAKGNAYLIGQATVEPWIATGAGDLPFALIQQRLYPRGAKDTGCSADMDNTLFSVLNDNSVGRMADVWEVISDAGIEERIAEATEVSAFGFMYEGHPLFCVKTDLGSFIFDARTKQWNNPQSYGLDDFRISCAAKDMFPTLLGDDSEGKLWELNGYEDDEGPLERLFTTYFPIDGGSVVVNNLWLKANVGSTGELSGQGANPVVEMRYSRDAGRTWSDWESAELGAQGEYRALPEWRALGTFDQPGAMFEFRVTDPVGFRVSGVFVNEPVAGRSR